MEENNKIEEKQESINYADETAIFDNNLPLLRDYNPPTPLNFQNFYISNPCNLTRRIYLHMLGAVDTYTNLLTLAPESDRQTIRNLRNQMQILSVSILNIGFNMNYCTLIPFRNGSNSRLPQNYAQALTTTYSRVYTIFYECLLLLDIMGTNTNQTTLLVIINNLRSQLQTINQLIANQG